MRGITEERLEQKFKEHEDNKTQIAEGYRFAIASCISECQELNPWQPIETAPKDRRILFFGSGIHEIGYWNSERQLFVDIYGIAIPNPTHWMELPEPPK